MNMQTIKGSAAAVAGLSLVIIIHEFGHFIACKIFSIATPVFSIGFGPQLIGYQIGSTIFQLAALPLGGFVAIDEAQLSAAAYLVKVIVILAGIASNFLFTFIIFTYFRLRGIAYQTMIEKALQDYKDGFFGPIGILSMIKYSAGLGIDYFFLVLALLSMSIGFFNLLPIPFLDGGQLVSYTIESLVGTVPAVLGDSITTIVIVLFLILLALLSFKDMARLWRQR